MIAPRGRPDASAADVESHSRTVRDSSSIPSAPAAQNLRVFTTGSDRKRPPRLEKATHMMAIEMCCTSLIEYAPVLPIRSIHVFVAP